MDRSELLRLASVGAAGRLQALQTEMAAILRQFPSLRGRVPTGRRRGAGRARRRRRMSADARRRISEAQKARWARQRANGPTASGGKKKK
jgi:hypothetical protein